MAKKTIAKTLFIGLGGTGNLALKYAKKRFYEIYKKDGETFDSFNIPLIQYLALDTDKDDLEEGFGEDGEYKLKGADCAYLEVTSPAVVLKNNSYIETEWMPKKNVSSLKKNRITDGAGQIRAFGRVGLMANYPKIRKKIRDKIGAINNWKNEQSSEYKAQSGGINIVFCFSIAGGTGSGSFLDMAYMVREALGDLQHNSQAYILLPEIFDKIIDEHNAKKRIWGNAYAALREIEFFMENKGPDSLDLLPNINIPVEGPPFDQICLMSDETLNGTEFDKKEHLMEVIGNSIVYKSGDLGKQAKSDWDNIVKDLQQMDYLDDAQTQKPRYVSIGYAELKYDTKHVIEFATKKYASFLSAVILNNNNQVTEQEMDFRVGGEGWKIKEDEVDFLIDQIHAPVLTQKCQPAQSYDGANTLNIVKPYAEGWYGDQLKTVISDCEKGLAKIKEGPESIIAKIKNDFLESGGILDKGGIETTLRAIETLQSEPFIERYVAQMNNEIDSNYNGTGEGLKKKKEKLESKIKTNWQDLEDAQGRMFLTRKSACEQVVGDIKDNFNKLLSYDMEIARRDSAKSFYGALKQELDQIKSNILNFKSKIEEVKEDYMADQDKELRHIKEHNIKPFIKNLHYDKIKEISQHQKSDVSLARFVEHLSAPLSSLVSASVDQIKTKVDDFMINFQAVDSLANTNLKTYIADLRATYPDRAKLLFENLQKMANPISQFDEDGFKISMGDNYTNKGLWGVPTESGVSAAIISQEIETDPPLAQTHDNTTVMYTTAAYPAPIASLKNLNNQYYNDYNDPKKQTFSYDIDKRIREAMDESKFTLFPKDTAEQKAIFAWIFGLILNKLDKNEGIKRSGLSSYKIKSQKGSILDDNWVDLGSSWRHLAFENFVEKNYATEMIASIKSKLDMEGGEFVENLIQEIKDKDTYINKYSSLGRSFEQLLKNPDGRDEEMIAQMTLELEFIRDFTSELISSF